MGEVIWTRTRPSGITIRKTREPFGVVAVVFESRPNVFVDTAALCLKTGNAIILRGGKEAVKSNAALARAVKGALAEHSSAITASCSASPASSPAITASCSASPASSPAITAAVQFVEVQDHAAVAELVRAVGLIDVAIPRGGERLIRAMCEAALIPVLKHYKGVCHVYVDDKADLGMALTILDNAKVQRPSACNAAECLLVHERLAPLFLPMVRAWAKDRGVTLHDDGAGVEYLSLDLNVATVPDVRAAIDYVNAHGSHHSDANERRGARGGVPARRRLGVRLPQRLDALHRWRGVRDGRGNRDFDRQAPRARADGAGGTDDLQIRRHG